MIEVRPTEVFADWLRKLRDENARARIQVRIRRLSLGNFGDVKPWARASALVLLLTGGSKKTQEADIAKAKKLAREWQKTA